MEHKKTLVKKLISIQAVISIGGALLISLFDTRQNGWSYLYGSGIVLINLLLHLFVWSRMIHKKLIALALSVIVFKYAILGTIIYKILRLPWMDSRGTLWFCIGVSSLMFSAVIFAISRKDDVI